MEFEFTYGVSRVLLFPMIKAGSLNFAVTGDWTPATGDTKISIDGGNVANTTNNPAAVGGTGSALWSLTLTAAECSGKAIAIQIVDAATKAVEDQSFIGYMKHAELVEVYQVNNVSTAPTATAFEADRGFGRTEEATADHFNGRNVLFLTGALQGQMTDITDYALQNARGFFTVTALTEAPADNDYFAIL